MKTSQAGQVDVHGSVASSLGIFLENDQCLSFGDR